MKPFISAKYILSGLLCFVLIAGYGQNYELRGKVEPTDKVDPTTFVPSLMERLILEKINKVRKENHLQELDTNEIFVYAARDQAKFMMEYAMVTTENKGKKKTTGKRVSYYGGSKQADEIVIREGVKTDQETYEQIAEAIVNKWAEGRNEKPVIMNGGYIYAGVGVAVDDRGKRVYASMVFGNYNSFNEGSEYRKGLAVPYTKKKYGLKPYDDRKCRKIDQAKNLQELHKGLEVRGDEVWFVYDDFKSFKRMIRGKKDGLAVDFIQRDQYPCEESYNVTDNDLVSKGVLAKRTWAKKLVKKNIIEDRKANKIETPVAKMPKEISEPYEMNLLVIKDKHVCKVLNRSYIEAGDAKAKIRIGLQPDTAEIAGLERFKPKAETTVLKFRVPFEKNKYDYRAEDINPILESMNEPDYIIKNVDIYAYSSIEGDSAKNAELQQKRAESIVTVLEGMQKEEAVTKNITTGDTWELFQEDVKSTEYASLAEMTKNQAKEEIRTKALHKKLEPVLSKHRYAEIVMDVTYDIRGKKEEPFVVRMFNNEIKAGTPTQALKIQKYIIDKVLSNQYSSEAIDAMVIPKKKKYASLRNNQVWLKNQLEKGKVTEAECAVIDELSTVVPENSVILYNNLYCNILHYGLGDKTEMEDVQEKIEELYQSDMDKELVNGLNLKYQFKILAAMDTLDTEEAQLVIDETRARIKEFYELDESNWNNSLKLARIFADNHDYDYAATLLEPFLDEKDVNEEVVFTYLSIATQVKSKRMTDVYNTAFEQAAKLNKDKYCKMFGEPYLTFQVFDNPKVKKKYCEVCE